MIYLFILVIIQIFRLNLNKYFFIIFIEINILKKIIIVGNHDLVYYQNF
jgi:hypothetical protein